MRRFAAVAALLALASSVPVSAQRGRGLPLSPGDPFPEIDVYDASGKPFNTKSLKGKYTVIVNGCLT